MLADCSVKLAQRTLLCSGILVSLLYWPAANTVLGQESNTQEWPEKLSTSFEDFEAGVLNELASSLGVWTVEKGRASIVLTLPLNSGYLPVSPLTAN